VVAGADHGMDVAGEGRHLCRAHGARAGVESGVNVTNKGTLAWQVGMFFSGMGWLLGIV